MLKLLCVTFTVYTLQESRYDEFASSSFREKIFTEWRIGCKGIWHGPNANNTCHFDTNLFQSSPIPECNFLI